MWVDRLAQQQTYSSLRVFLYHNFSVAGYSCVFIPSLFLYFLQIHPYSWLIFTENFLPLVYVPFLLLGSTLVKEYDSTS